MTYKAAFHLSELTDQPIPIVMRISLLIKTNDPHQSNPTVLCTTEMVFQQNFLEKAHFSAKMSGPAIVRPATVLTFGNALSWDRENYTCPKVTKMGSKSGHRIDNNGVGVLRRQRQLTQVLPVLYHTFHIFTFSEKQEHLPSTLPS